MLNIIEEKIEIEPSLKKKIEIICEFAKSKPKFINGSIMDEELLECLVQNASCIRIIFPGITPIAYDFYSNQLNYKFDYEKAINLLESLTKKRKKNMVEKMNFLLAQGHALDH